jgi:hypothetical protein
MTIGPNPNLSKGLDWAYLAVSISSVFVGMVVVNAHRQPLSNPALFFVFAFSFMARGLAGLVGGNRPRFQKYALAAAKVAMVPALALSTWNLFHAGAVRP